MIANPLPGVPSVESPFFDAIFKRAETDAETLRIATDLHRDGFAVLDFPDAEFDAMANRIIKNLSPRFDWDGWRTNTAGLRLQDAFKFDDDVRRIAVNQQVIDLLTRLFGRAAWPFQTLNFPVGSQQHYHTDAIHFSSIPERFMCGVWTALEDVDSQSGPLVYYPGSHRWPIYTNENLGIKRVAGDQSDEPYKAVWRALVEQSGIQPRIFEARKGQSLIWLSNLLHGGMAHTNKAKTRWSQVTHYYFEDCAYYTPMHSDPFIGKVEFRELNDIRSGRQMPNRYAGMTIPRHMTRQFHPARVAIRRLRNFLHI